MSQDKRVCRLCLEPEKDKQYMKIFARNSLVALRIFNSTGIVITELRNIPALICSSCLKVLYEVDQFRTKCRQADIQFRKFMIATERRVFKSSCLSDSLVFPKNNLTQDDQNVIVSENMRTVDFDCGTSFIKADPDENVNKADLSKIVMLREKSCMRTTNHSQPGLDIEPRKTREKLKKKKVKVCFICRFCGKTCDSESRLITHEKSHMDISLLSANELFFCDLCNRKFKTKTSLRNHFMYNHTPKNLAFPCSTCGKILPHEKSRYSHEATHVKTDSPCPYCNKVFDRKVLLTQHIKVVHLKVKMKQCPHCAHQAVTGGALVKHIRCVHLNLRRFHCDWDGCNKVFHENGHLVRHYRVHTGETPFQCRNTPCDSKFKGSGSRNRHERNHCPHRTTQQQQ